MEGLPTFRDENLTTTRGLIGIEPSTTRQAVKKVSHQKSSSSYSSNFQQSPKSLNQMSKDSIQNKSKQGIQTMEQQAKPKTIYGGGIPTTNEQTLVSFPSTARKNQQENDLETVSNLKPWQTILQAYNDDKTQSELAQVPDKEDDANKSQAGNYTPGKFSAAKSTPGKHSHSVSNSQFENMLEEKFNAVFFIGQKKHKYTKTSLFCLDQHSRFRRFFVNIMVNKWFERFIIVCIVVNSLLLASKQYDSNFNANYDSSWNKTLDQIDLAFTIIFTAECLVKIIAMGFIGNKNAYLRSGWNIIDFCIVIISLVSITPAADQSSLKAFRTARILRPLRSINQLQSMRMIIQALIASIPRVFNVCIFMAFQFTIFAIIGVQFFVGKQYQFCRATPTITDDNVNPPFWEINTDAIWQCSSDEMCSGYPNNLGSNVVAKCGDVYRDYGLDPQEFDGALKNQMINYDIANFNNVGAASITIFQVMTLEGWSNLMQNYQDTTGYATASIYFVILVILGSFTSLNLILASIMYSFLQEENKLNMKDIESKSKREPEPANSPNTLDNIPLRTRKSSQQLPRDEQQTEEKESQSKAVSINIQDAPPENANQYASSSMLTLEVEMQTFQSLTRQQSQETTAEKPIGIKVRGLNKFKNKNSIQDGPLMATSKSQKTKEMFVIEDDLGLRTGNFTNSDSRSMVFGRLGSAVDRVLETARSSVKAVDEQPQPFIEVQGMHEQREKIDVLRIVEIDSRAADHKSDLFVQNHHHQGSFESRAEVATQQIKLFSSKTQNLEIRSGDGSRSIKESKSNIEDLQELEIEERAQGNRVYGFFYGVVMSVSFNFLIYCFILGNTVTLALYRYDQSDMQTAVLNIFDFIFVWIFTFEMFFKLIGFGVKNYVKDKFNVFDGFIVVISLVDFSLSVSLDLEGSATGVMGALRALRLLRIIKLARHWEAFQEILSRMVKSLLDISNFSFLLLLFMFIAALLGMEIFSYSVCYDINGDAVFGKDNIQSVFASGQQLTWPRTNFNNIFNSLVTVFAVIVGDDWNSVMYLYMRAAGTENSNERRVALAYFLILYVIGNTILLAIFTALLLKNFETNLQLVQKRIQEKSNEMIQNTLRSTQSKTSQELSKSSFSGFCKSCCTRKAFRNRLDKCSDRFIEIFGGERAIEKHLKLRGLKDPRISASPNSGNAVTPNFEIQLSKSHMVIGVQEIKQTEEQKLSVIELQNMLSPDKIDTENSLPLQRPPSLLHYDYEQVQVVKDRSNPRAKKAHIQGKSLYIFSSENSIRKFCDVVTSHWVFESFIILLILLSTITLAFEHPLIDSQSDMMKRLNLIDLVVTSIFCVEALMKIIKFGFILNGSKSYIRKTGNVLDFFIILLSVISLSIDANISFIKVLRVARILRPLRLIQRAEGLKIAIKSLYKALPQIMRLQVVVLFLMFIISILLTTLLSGKIFKCELAHTNLAFKQQQSLINNSWDCANYGGEWVSQPLNFDNTLRGMLTLFIFQSREGWAVLMWDSVDAVGVNQSPVQGNSPAYIVFYILLIIILSLLLENMFVGIVIQTYNMEKDWLNFNQLLTQAQRSWIQVQIMTYAVKPIPIAKASQISAVRNLCIKVSQSRYFENFIMVCILLNTITMALLWFDQPEILPKIIENINHFFLAVFAHEAIIKIVALKKTYFYNSWNRFDFGIVIVTLVIQFLQLLNIQVQFSVGLTVLRILRIGRILRLIKHAHQLQIIFDTLLDSAGSLGSLGMLLMIFFFMFAIIGRNLFGLASIGKVNLGLNQHVNFRDFSSSFLLLMQCSTGESWYLIMLDLAKTYSPTYQCRENETYESMMINGGEPFDCGQPFASYVFFVLFSIIVQIFLNLFVAIVIDAFLGQTDHFNLPVQKYSLQEFVNIWSRYDPNATGFINISDLDDFIVDLTKSQESRLLVIFADKIATDASLRNRFIGKLCIPTYCQLKKVMFYDVLQQLCDKNSLLLFFKEQIRTDMQRNTVLNRMGVKTQDEFSLIMNSKQRSEINFDKTIRNMGRLNPKIKLMVDLQKEFRRVHETYAVYADTESNMNLSDEERRKLSFSDLQKLNMQGQFQRDDINVFTTMHYFYGALIAKSYRSRHDRKPLVTQELLSNNCPINSQRTFTPATGERFNREQFGFAWLHSLTSRTGPRLSKNFLYKRESGSQTLKNRAVSVDEDRKMQSDQYEEEKVDDHAQIQRERQQH